MSGSEKFQIKRLESFERSLKNLLRAHYRKNPAGQAEFVNLVGGFLKLLSVDPRPRPPLGHLEPWPQATTRTGWELWKLEFKMPQIRTGEAGQGRLIYLINSLPKKVGLVWIYTHAEYEKRPSDKELKSLLSEFMDNYELSDENNISTELEDGETEEKTRKG